MISYPSPSRHGWEGGNRVQQVQVLKRELEAVDLVTEKFLSQVASIGLSPEGRINPRHDLRAEKSTFHRI